MWDWSELPTEIIHMISLRIDNPFDLIHFRSVCSWWRSSSLATFRPVPSHRCPLPADVGGCGDDCHILRTRVYLITSVSRDPPPRFWLFKLQEEENGAFALQCLFGSGTSSEFRCSYPSLSLDLLNSQVTELAQEHVACYTSWCDLFDEVGYPYKGVESIGYMQLDAENKEFMILGRLSFQGLGMYRSFEQRWTEIETTTPLFAHRITSFNGNFYVIDPAGVTLVVKPTLEVSSFQRSRPCDKTRRRWLVKSEDKLLLVEMCTKNRNEYVTPKLLAEKGWFEVSELNKERNDWIKVEDLGGRVLFLDYDCSLSCLPNQVPGFRPNSIIFMGIFGCYTNRHESFEVFEFGEQGFRSFGDIPEYIRLFPSPPWMFSNG
ncbi:hypothetical protein EUTSA_v10005528mg [Eutrema salsugineum]|uniref:KIB1-4 beta-propeller domain-containing protein n=1 Tax=Eutrema salsugineum TaxID=72664 RepID=V4KX38_EUTSA|nr:putative F-box/kelch-repeat protein At5g24040 [Eutrema salsugineum]ESQ31948.1 hypothetical protein EUTSA_v10005528mg [Eutrema salsugineum]